LSKSYSDLPEMKAAGHKSVTGNQAPNAKRIKIPDQNTVRPPQCKILIYLFL
jgi:hypothetical protein